MYIALNIAKNMKFTAPGIVLVPSKPVAFFDEMQAPQFAIDHIEQAIKDEKIFKLDESQKGAWILKGTTMTAPVESDDRVVGRVERKLDEDGQLVTVLTFPEE